MPSVDGTTGVVRARTPAADLGSGDGTGGDSGTAPPSTPAAVGLAQRRRSARRATSDWSPSARRRPSWPAPPGSAFPALASSPPRCRARRHTGPASAAMTISPPAFREATATAQAAGTRPLTTGGAVASQDPRVGLPSKLRATLRRRRSPSEPAAEPLRRPWSRGAVVVVWALSGARPAPCLVPGVRDACSAPRPPHVRSGSSYADLREQLALGTAPLGGSVAPRLAGGAARHPGGRGRRPRRRRGHDHRPPGARVRVTGGTPRCRGSRASRVLLGRAVTAGGVFQPCRRSQPR